MFDMTLFRLYLRHLLLSLLCRCHIKKVHVVKERKKEKAKEARRRKEYKTVFGNNVCRLLFESRWNYILSQMMAQNTKIMD